VQDLSRMMQIRGQVLGHAGAGIQEDGLDGIRMGGIIHLEALQVGCQKRLASWREIIRKVEDG